MCVVQPPTVFYPLIPFQTLAGGRPDRQEGCLRFYKDLAKSCDVRIGPSTSGSAFRDVEICRSYISRSVVDKYPDG